MKTFTLLLTLCCQLSADDKVVAQNQQAPVARFDWAPIQINGKQYIALNKLKEFYFLNQEKLNNKVVRLENKRIIAEFTINEHSAHINGVLFYLSEPIRNKNDIAHISTLDVNSLIDPILRPTWITNAKPVKTVILDAGHGGKDKGSAELESKHTLAIAKLINEALTKKGYKVILTREREVTVPLENRVKIINGVEDAVVISLHFNSGKKEVSGFETYIMSARQPHASNQASVALATALHARSLLYLNDPKFGNNFKIKDRGIRRAKFRLLKDSKHPTVLIEAGFLTDKGEAKKIASAAYQKTLTTAIVRGIDVYNASLGRKK